MDWSTWEYIETYCGCKIYRKWMETYEAYYWGSPCDPSFRWTKAAVKKNIEKGGYCAVPPPEDIAVVTIWAPGSAEAGQQFNASGIVYDKVTGQPYDGVPVDVYYNGKLLGGGYTGVDGDYLVSGSIGTAGTYALKAKAMGVWSDPTTITITAPPEPPPGKIPTSITIGVSPASGAPPLDVSIAGVLTRNDTGAGIPNATIRIYRDGVRIASVLTDSYGLYAYYDRGLGSGVYEYYTLYEGSPTLEGCEEWS